MGRNRLPTALLLLLPVALLIGPWPLSAAGSSVGTTQLVSRTGNGTAAGGAEPHLTAGGKVLVFTSSAALHPDDTDGLSDVYLADSPTQPPLRISAGAAPAQRPAVSADGLVIAFDSPAPLLPDDDNAVHDVLVVDRKNDRTLLVSRSNEGTPGNAGSFSPAVSANGRVIAFDSNATNLVSGDTNNAADVFVVDLAAAKIERVSIASTGDQGNAGSFEPAISADGRFVAFHSTATNLSPADTNNVSDVFLHDRLTRTTTRVSLTSFGMQADGPSFAAALSADGRVVAFDSLAANLVTGDFNAAADVFVHDTVSAVTVLASVTPDGLAGAGSSVRPALSADGRVVAFSSTAADLIAGDSNLRSDVFVRDLQTGETTRISVRDRGGQANADSTAVTVSADGSSTAFVSSADNLVTNDGNGSADVFLHQFAEAPPPIGGATRVSVSSNGAQANGNSHRAAISADGRVIAFDSNATNLILSDRNGVPDVFVRDLNTNLTSRISVSSSAAEANGGSYSPAVSADGRVIAFDSNATNLVSGDTNGAADVFVHDRTTGQTTRVSVSSTGVQGNAGSYAPSISGDGRYVAFHSVATNLVTDDRNNTFDVFLHDRLTGQTRIVSRATDGTAGNGGSYSASLSGDGSIVAFDSNASTLVKDDTNGTADAFVHRLADGVTERVSLNDLSGEANGPSLEPAVSADGALVVFYSHAANLVENDTNRVADVFVRDRVTQTTKRVSLATGGEQGNGPSQSPAIARDGRYVVFTSDADNLGKLDTNRTSDVFLHDRESGVTTRISVAAGGDESDAWSGTASVADGAVLVVFDAAAANLSSGDSNGAVDIFLRDAAPPTAFTQPQMLRFIFLPEITP